MKQTKYPLLILGSVMFLLLIAAWLNGRPALSSAAPAGPAAPTPVADLELVRNGGFDQDKTGWYISGTGSGVSNVGQDGGPAMAMEAIMENQADLFQELYLPSQTTAAKFSFDYRLLPPDFPSPGTMTGFYASVITPSGVITNVLAVPFMGDTGWQQAEFTLNTAAVSQMQAAHAAGEHVYVFFRLYQEPSNVFKAYVDNVSFQVSGSMDVPALSGSIGYMGMDSNGYPKTVKRIDPDGSGQQTVWTHPSSIPDTNHIYDVAWKPDASELAFSSNHESIYSAFQSDVYGVQPDGSGLRRITNPPSKAELEAGSYQTGTVTGKVHNNYGNVTTFLLYVEGAREAVSVNVGNFGDETGFTVNDVADLGTGLHYVVFTWSDINDANCKEYAAAVVDVQPNQTVDAGTLTFSGHCGKYNSDSISWKRDGSEVGVDVITPRKFQATGEAIGSDLFNAPLTADELAWSPVDQQILYRNWIVSGDSGIYLTSEGGDQGTWLVNAGDALWVTPAWLPDGSGFVFTLDNYLYEYDLSSSQTITLAVFYNEYVFNPSPSPDGNYVVFERQSIKAPLQSDLWIMNRNKPVEMWPLTDDGQSGNPDWSRQDPGSACTALSQAGISGPTSGYTGTLYAFTAVITPSNASTPITYTWSTDGLVSGQNTSSASYNWTTSGDHTVSLEAENCGGSDTANHTINLQAQQPGCDHPLSQAGISGPTSGYTGTLYAFTAVVTPSNASTPITYTWSTDGLVSGQNTSSASYNWTTSGDHTVSLEAENCGGSDTVSHTINLQAQQPTCAYPLTDVGIDGPARGFTGTLLAFSAVVTPGNASTPITYTWSTAGLVNGQGTAQASYRWAVTGTQSITVNAQNCGGDQTDAHQVTLVAVKYRVYLPLSVRNH